MNSSARAKAVSGLAAIVATIILSVVANLLTPAVEENLGLFGQLLTSRWLPLAILIVLGFLWYLGLTGVRDESRWRADKLTFLSRRLTRLGEILARL